MLGRNFHEWEKGIIVRPSEILGNETSFNMRNQIMINGIFEDDLEYSHNTFGERFYRGRVMVKRESGVIDYVPIVISETIRNTFRKETLKDKYIEAIGKFKSINQWDEFGIRHLILFMYVTDAKVYEINEIPNRQVPNNLIYLDGYICKPTYFRTTTLTNRKITDLVIAVNTNYGMCEYIPCIAWGRNAYFTRKLEVGDRVILCGRVQSKKYFKKFDYDCEDGEWKWAYEISIIEIVKGNI